MLPGPPGTARTDAERGEGRHVPLRSARGRHHARLKRREIMPGAEALSVVHRHAPAVGPPGPAMACRGHRRPRGAPRCPCGNGRRPLRARPSPRRDGVAAHRDTDRRRSPSRSRIGTSPGRRRPSSGWSSTAPPHAMTAPSGTPDFQAGARFRYATTLPAGTHAISFWAADDHGSSDRDQAGLVKIAGQPAGVSDGGHDGGVTPGSGHTPVGGGTTGGGGGSGGSSPSQPPAPTPPPAAPGLVAPPPAARRRVAPHQANTMEPDHPPAPPPAATGQDAPIRPAPPTTRHLPAPRDGTADGGASTGHPTDPSAAPIPAPADATAGSDTAEHADGRTHGGWPPADAVVLASEGGSAGVRAGRTGPGRSLGRSVR